MPEKQAELRAFYSVENMIENYNSSEQEKIFDRMKTELPPKR